MNKVISHADAAMSREVLVSSNQHLLSGELKVPQNASGIVLFAHGSGSSRHSPRNRYVARRIRDAGVATLLFDLLTPQEEEMDLRTREFRFNITLLARRLADATRWVNERADRIADKSHVRHLRVGYFGASTGGAAALVAAAELGARVGAVVSRGGRPDLAGEALGQVKSPTLLIVGGLDKTVIELNKSAYARLHCEKELKVVPNASHLFEEPGTLDEVARLAAEWFRRHLEHEDEEGG